MLSILKLHDYRGSVFAALLLFFFSEPYFFWGEFFRNNYTQFGLAVLMAFLFLRNKDFNGVLKFLFFYFLLLLVAQSTIQNKNLFYILGKIPFIVLPFSNFQFTKSAYNNFLNIYCFILGLSLFVWLLSLVGIAPTLGTITPLNSLKQYSLIHYPLLVQMPGGFRFSGVFDEPGVVGTLSGLLLCIQRFKDIRSLILLATGFCSMSLYFFVMIVAYFLLYYFIKERSGKKVLLFIFIVIGAFLLIRNVPFFNDIIGERLKWDSENLRFVGDNRDREVVTDYFYSIIDTKEFWLGINNKADFLQEIKGECSIYITIIMNGMIFCIFYLLFIILYGLHYKKNWFSFFLFIFVFLSCVYQRPFLFSASFIFLWTYLARLNMIEELELEEDLSK